MNAKFGITEHVNDEQLGAIEVQIDVLSWAEQPLDEQVFTLEQTHNKPSLIRVLFIADKEAILRQAASRVRNGRAWHNPMDVFDFLAGMDIAMSRACSVGGPKEYKNLTSETMWRVWKSFVKHYKSDPLSETDPEYPTLWQTWNAQVADGNGIPEDMLEALQYEASAIKIKHMSRDIPL
jgi:hypothetical protein